MMILSQNKSNHHSLLEREALDSRHSLARSVLCRFSGLAARYTQALARSDAHLHSLGLNSSTLPDWWRDSPRSSFASVERNRRLCEVYRERDLERSLILRRADHIVNGKMPILGHEPLEFTGDDRWRRDHILGVSAPETIGAETDLTDPKLVGDVRRLWEPSRFGWAYWLGQAYTLTGERRYAETFESLTLDWFEWNVFAQGINYTCAGEIALRTYAWLRALDLFAVYLAVRPRVLSKLLQGVWQSCELISKRSADKSGARSSAILESFALYATGASLPEFAEAYHWRTNGAEGLAEAAVCDFLVDGSHKSLSASGALYAVDCYLQYLLIARNSGFRIDSALESHARMIIGRLSELVPADLTLPQFNDCDGGRLSWFCMGPRDAAPALQSGALLFDDFTPQLGDRIYSGYALWMAPSVEQMRQSPPGAGKREPVWVDSSGGKSVHERVSDELTGYMNVHGDYLLLRCQSLTQQSDSAHDAPGGFTLHLAHRPVIVDSGTGSFTQSQQIRDSFRSARGKNSLLINNRGPSQTGRLFDWTRFTPVRLMAAREFEGGFYSLCRHSGFSELCGFTVDIEREIIILNEGLALLIDHWTAEREIETSLELTVSTEFKISRAGRMIYEEDGSLFHYLVSPQFTIESDSDETAEDESDSDIEEDADSEESERDIRFKPQIKIRPFSPDYGVIGECPALVSDFRASRNGTVITAFSRIGPVKNTPDLARFAVGDEDDIRELLVGASGKISLEGARRGPKREVSIVFAR